MPLYNPVAIPAGSSTGGDLTVTGNLIGQHDVSAGGNLIGSAGNGLKLLAGGTPLTPTAAATLYGLSATNLPAYVSPSGQIASVGGVLQAQSSTVTVANTASPTALQSYTVPAADAAAGAVYELTGQGVYSDTGTPTLQFILYWGGVAGTALVTVPAVTLPLNITNSPFSYTATVNFRSTTSAFAVVTLNIDTSVATDLCSTYVGTPTAAVTVTTTGANALTMGVTWGTASSSNTISLNGGMVERLA